MGKIKMNKLIIDKEKLIEDYHGEIFYNSSVIINIKGNCTLIDYESNNDLIINLDTNSSLNYYRIRKNPSNTKTIINHYKDSKCIFKESILNNKNDFNYEIDVNINNDKNINNIYLRVINELGNSHIIVNGNVLGNTHDNILLEDLRGLNLKDTNLIIEPNMEILSNDIEANHNVTISNVNKDDLRYLESKKVNNEQAINLLKNGFVFGMFPIELKENIKNILE